MSEAFAAPAAGDSLSDVARRRLSCAAAALAGALLVFVTFYPGHMQVDQFLQLREARSLSFLDWHPPLMSRLWAELDRIAPGAIGMFVLQNAMFWVGLATVVYLARLPRRLSVLLILGIGLFPPIFSSLGVLWKDVSLIGALLLAYAMFLYAHLNRSYGAIAVGLIALFYGFSLRHNAAPAVIPIALWAGFVVCRTVFRRRIRPVVPVALGVILFVAMGVSIQMINEVLVDGRRTYPLQNPLLFDLVAISVKTDKVVLPESTRVVYGQVSVGALKCLYSPNDSQYMFNGRLDTCGLKLQKITTEPPMRDLVATWLRTVPANLGPYLEHRLDVFKRLFAMDGERVCYPLEPGNAHAELGIEAPKSILDRPAILASAVVAYGTPFYRGWVYLVGCAVLLLLALRRRDGDRVPALVLGSSGILYGLAYLVVGTSCDYRYLLWLVVATAVLLALTVWRARWTAPRVPGA